MSQNNSQKIKFSGYGPSQARSHSEFGQAAYTQQYVYPPPMPSVQSNSGHDMNKQLAAGQPGMFQNSGGMASVQQHHQSQMGGPVPSQQQASLVQQGQQLSRGPMSAMQINNFYPRPNVPRSMSSMGRNPLTPVVNQTGQQPTSQYSHVQVVQSAPFHPGIHNPIQPMIMNQYQQVYPQRQFSQYPLQPVFVNNWNNYSNPPQPNTNGFFPHGISTFNTMAPQMPQQQQQQVTPQQTQPRSKRLAIIDPNTGKNIFDASNDENNSSPPLEKETALKEKEKFEMAQEKATKLVFQEKNAFKSPYVIDLHGLIVKEAISKLDNFLKYHKGRLEALPGTVTITVITGQGNHSIDGRSELQSAVMQFLNEAYYDCRLATAGSIKVSLCVRGKEKQLARWKG